MLGGSKPSDPTPMKFFHPSLQSPIFTKQNPISYPMPVKPIPTFPEMVFKH